MSRIVINEFEIIPNEAPQPKTDRDPLHAAAMPTPEEIREIVSRHAERVKRVSAD